MSKRYGRNRKRRDREAIARLEAANIKLARTLAHSDGDARQLRAELSQWRPKLRIKGQGGQSSAWDDELAVHLVVSREVMDGAEDRRWAVSWAADAVRKELARRLRVKL